MKLEPWKWDRGSGVVDRGSGILEVVFAEVVPLKWESAEVVVRGSGIRRSGTAEVVPRKWYSAEVVLYRLSKVVSENREKLHAIFSVV